MYGGDSPILRDGRGLADSGNRSLRIFSQRLKGFHPGGDRRFPGRLRLKCRLRAVLKHDEDEKATSLELTNFGITPIPVDDFCEPGYYDTSTGAEL